MKTVHFFAFYLHNLLKITEFSPWSSMNLKIQNLYILMRMGGDIVTHFQFSGSQSVLFKSQSPHLWDFTPTFIMISPYFHDDLLLLLGWFAPAFMMRRFNIDWIPAVYWFWLTVLFVKTDVVYTLVILFLTGLSAYGLIPNQVYTISVIPNFVVTPKSYS